MSPENGDGPSVHTPGPADHETSTAARQLNLFAQATAPQATPATGEPVDVDPFWRDHAWTALLELAETGQAFTSYDIVRVHGVGEPAHPNQWGPLLAAAREAGLIVAIGATPSARPSVAKSLVRVWRGAGGAAA